MKTESDFEKLDLETRTPLDRCSASQLRDLLGLGVAENESPTSLPAEAGNTAEVARLLTGLLSEERSGQVLLDAVSEPDAPLEALRQIKDVAKRLLEEARTEPQRNAARVLYHAAIAAAYAGHSENISSLPIGPRMFLYEDLAAVLSGKPLGAVFRRAVERASQNEQESGK
jgi:hypothetical protein